MRGPDTSTYTGSLIQFQVCSLKTFWRPWEADLLGTATEASDSLNEIGSLCCAAEGNLARIEEGDENSLQYTQECHCSSDLSHQWYLHPSYSACTFTIMMQPPPNPGLAIGTSHGVMQSVSLHMLCTSANSWTICTAPRHPILQAVAYLHSRDVVHRPA